MVNDWVEEIPATSKGTAEPVTDEGDEPQLAAMLYLPSPDTRSGWTLHQIVKKTEPKVTRAIGFWRAQRP